MRFWLPAFLGLSVIVTIPAMAATDVKSICNIAPKADTFNFNPLLVTSISRFGLRLDEDVDRARAITPQMVVPPKVSTKDFFIDQSVVEPYSFGYHCKRDGLASIGFDAQARLPTTYNYCFTIPNGTFFDAEQFLEDGQGIPRAKWLVHARPLTSYRARLLRKTRLGSWLQGIESGSYNLKVNDRYFIGFIMVIYHADRMAIHFRISDSTDAVKRQIACEEQRD